MVGYMCPAVAYRGSQELYARVVSSGNPCAGAVLPWGLDAGSWGHALWQHRKSSKGHLPGQQVQGACVLNWCECGAQRLAAREGEVLVSAARAMLTCLDMSLPSGAHRSTWESPVGAVGLRRPACWEGTTVVPGSQQPAAGVLCPWLDLYMPRRGSQRHLGTTCQNCEPRGACTLKPQDCCVCE